MKYDVIKDKLAFLIDLVPSVRVLFYKLLHMLFLREWYIQAKIKKYFPPSFPIRFYDAGAGFGQYSYFILKHWNQARVLAVDLKTDYMDSFKVYAEDRGWEQFKCRQADLQDYVPKGKYDLILAVDILEHIEDDVQVMKNFREALSTGGKLIISSPSNLDKAAEFTEEHVRAGYSKADIISKLESAGFKIVSFEYSYGFWGHLYWLLALKTPMNILKKSMLLFPLLIPYYLVTYPLSHVFMHLDMKAGNTKGTGIIVVAE
ncbi:MAG TPA: methyltransferase domain-containing protein [Candidatus Cloacimonadota bacterium]|nr:methyltransferase domain-containing protein [Candidatus Cloacimonadota bacterium]HPT72333.1 methyltransferase domain-containing protein [Candidatus Cloacimonadota bacterium]